MLSFYLAICFANSFIPSLRDRIVDHLDEVSAFEAVCLVVVLVT